MHQANEDIWIIGGLQKVVLRLDKGLRDFPSLELFRKLFGYVDDDFYHLVRA